MFNPDRPAAFVLVATDHGPMIVNRQDYSVQGGGVIGVGVELFNYSHYDDAQLDLLCKVLELRRESHGDGVVAIDGGANIGAYTLTWARMMTGWGAVLAFEPQERIFYALAGSIALNNCFNAKAICAAIGKGQGFIRVPCLDHSKSCNFGGVSLVDVAANRPCDEVPLASIDSLGLPRLDMLKLDIEGMELEALHGAQDTIIRCKPIVCVEHIISGLDAIKRVLEPAGYQVQMTGMNVLGVHRDDPVSARLRYYDSEAA